jgi:hypothetical protein
MWQTVIVARFPIVNFSAGGFGGGGISGCFMVEREREREIWRNVCCDERFIYLIVKIRRRCMIRVMKDGYILINGYYL